MQKDLFIMERAIALNIYQPRQARYRGLDIVPGKSSDSLWTARPARYVIFALDKILFKSKKGPIKQKSNNVEEQHIDVDYLESF